MKSSVTIIIAVVSCGLLAWAQGTTPTAKSPTPGTPSTQAPASQTPPVGATGQLKVRGPEAVAQQDPNKVVASINGHPITAQQAVTILNQIPEAQRSKVPSLASLLQQVYMVDHFSGEAEKLKLDQQSPWKEELELNRKQVLAQAYVNDLGKTPASSMAADAQQYYNTHQPEFEQVKLSGILIAFNPPGTPASGAQVSRTETEAQQKANDLEKKIKDGGDFSALARVESDQQQSAVRGGDLGTITVGDANLPAAIREPVAKLQPGQVSEPVRVNGGYFILKVNSRTKLPYEQVRQRIIQKLEVDKYKIQVQDPDFFASTAPSSHTPSLLRSAPPPAPPPTKPHQGQ